MQYNPDNPLIIQSDGTIFVEVNSPFYMEVRDKLAKFADLIRSPEHIHTYRISALSLWNASAMGMPESAVVSTLNQYAKYPIPEHILAEIHEQLSRYGLVQLKLDGEQLKLVVNDEQIYKQLLVQPKLGKFLSSHPDEYTFGVQPLHRGEIKQALIKIGFPTQDLAGYTQGSPLKLSLRDETVGGDSFQMRHYQTEALDMFFAGGSSDGGHGVVVLPCGAGKTIVGLGAMQRLQTSTLILVTNVMACRQWIREVIDKLDVDPEWVGEYSGATKEIKPITVATYQILTHRKSRQHAFSHFSLFSAANWGLVIYDEVHLLPAPVFRMASVLQARMRLGLTATLIREDGLEEDVFSLIGPKRYDLPWRELEKDGYLSIAECWEYRVPLPLEKRIQYAAASDRQKIRIAAENPSKMEIVQKLCDKHEEDQILIIGHYIEQLTEIAEYMDAPLITGKTKNQIREDLYHSFRQGEIKKLVVSKVANFALDLPGANVLIQVSGTFGSRQEEAQRLGRILRPKTTHSTFYSLVTKDSREQEFSLKRQLFLTEQGYKYQQWNTDGGVLPSSV